LSDQDICKSLASEHTLHDWSLHTSRVSPVMLIHGQFDTKFSFPNKYGDQTLLLYCQTPSLRVTLAPLQSMRILIRVVND
jgi:hypothetical protein